MRLPFSAHSLHLKTFGITDDITFPEHSLIYVKYYGVIHLSVPCPLWFCVFYPDSLILYAWNEFEESKFKSRVSFLNIGLSVVRVYRTKYAFQWATGSAHDDPEYVNSGCSIRVSFTSQFCGHCAWLRKLSLHDFSFVKLCSAPKEATMCWDVKSDTTVKCAFAKVKHFILLLSSWIMLFILVLSHYKMTYAIWNGLYSPNGKLKDVNS